MWQITKLECIPNLNGLQDAVVKVHWEYELTSGGESESFVGVTQVEVDPNNFTPYNQLTQAEILAWIWGKFSKQATEDMVAIRLAERIAPPLIDPPLPWA